MWRMNYFLPYIRLFQFVQQDGHIFKSDVHFVSYRTGTSYNPLKDKSGAYIFLPDGAAKVIIVRALTF